MMIRPVPAFLCGLVLFSFLSSTFRAQQYSSDLYQSMRWRMIGPFRGGRTVGAAGIPGQPNVFYIGVSNGGAWYNTSCVRTWQLSFEEQATGSNSRSGV